MLQKLMPPQTAKDGAVVSRRRPQEYPF